MTQLGFDLYGWNVLAPDKRTLAAAMWSLQRAWSAKHGDEPHVEVREVKDSPSDKLIYGPKTLSVTWAQIDG